MLQRMVVVLGGNAFAGPGGRLTMEGQLQFAHDALRQLRPLLPLDTRLLISHGNGPQVGQIVTRVEAALGQAYAIPLEVCVAESEGELGYVLEQALHNVLVECGLQRPICTLLTQVVVAESDPAFVNPTKPIGVFYDRTAADALQRRGFAVREDAGRGFRRVVPSPEPLEIVELGILRTLFDTGVIAIAAGGGGVPVVRRDGRLTGVEAVIDKDLTAALLAHQLDAELLIILTDVPCAYRYFRSPQQEPIGRISVNEARRLIAEGHFASGSMQPKVEAAARFAVQPGRRAIICSPPLLADALRGTAGTIVAS